MVSADAFLASSNEHCFISIYLILMKLFFLSGQKNISSFAYFFIVALLFLLQVVSLMVVYFTAILGKLQWPLLTSLFFWFKDDTLIHPPGTLRMFSVLVPFSVFL